MSSFAKQRRKGISYAGFPLLFFCFLQVFNSSFAQAPANDNCNNAKVITIPDGGFGLGRFTSSIDDISNATVQSGETFAPAILVAGLNKKSMWYKFNLPTTRAVRVTLGQPGSAIVAGNAGFAVYKTNTCIPAGTDISNKLTPIGTFGNTFQPCVDKGDYLVQVSSTNAANGPLYVQINISDSTTGVYDHPAQAYNFGVVSPHVKKVDYSVGCHSIEDAAEVCPVLNNAGSYTKTAWHTFTTPAYFDYLSVMLSGTNGYFSTGSSVKHTFGYRLYKGNAANTPVSSLTALDGCDSLQSNGYYAGYKMYTCAQLERNTTYTVQLFYKETFFEDVRLAIAVGGTQPAHAPEPILSNVPATNNLGNLPSSGGGITKRYSDYLGCNSRHTAHPCNPSLPSAGINYNNRNYNLSTFYTFTLVNSAKISFYASQDCGPSLLLRLYKQGLTNNCASLDTSNMVGRFVRSADIDCLSPGTYTLQISGTDEIASFSYFNYYDNSFNRPLCLASNLGSKFELEMTAYNRTGFNKFSLNKAEAIDTINRVAGLMTPLVSGKTYKAAIDTFGCENTVRPADTTCHRDNAKVIYRTFSVADSGIVSFTDLTSSVDYKLYQGNAASLATAQNAFTYPSVITGLKPMTTCMSYYTNCGGEKVCLTPGTYTFTSFGSDNDKGKVDRPTIDFNIINTKHHSAATAQDMGSVVDSLRIQGSSYFYSDIDHFSCRDNAVPINGITPCAYNSGKPATKAIYRQFYLSQSSIVTIAPVSSCGYGGSLSVFKGKATDGLTGLTALGADWRCFRSSQTSPQCDPFEPGWYTVVSYGAGPTYDDPLKDLNQTAYGSHIGMPNQFYINIKQACPAPKYNRPYKAAIDTVTKQPFLIEWKQRFGTTNAYPRTDTTYKLYPENLNCSTDTPFSSHPIVACNAKMKKVMYYVFRTTQESYVVINTGDLWGAVYAGDVRKDSASFATATPIQPCVIGEGKIEICKLQPGAYTLVMFSDVIQNCATVRPSIYIDKVGYSRFDHAAKAYDFGVVPADSIYYNGKPGDVNPLDAGRAPSNDFFYCTTGSQKNDPAEAKCFSDYNANIYKAGNNNYMYAGDVSNNPDRLIPRRNLWYTFVVDKPGWVRIKVRNKTKGKEIQYPFAVYKSDVDGKLPFSTVLATGQVDSTAAQGLTFIQTNLNNRYYCNGEDSITFYRDACSQKEAERYYILVDNRNPFYYGDINSMAPNSQVEVSILVDPVNLAPTKYDHHYQAYNFGSIGVGTHTGGTDNYACATPDVTDPTDKYASCAIKTLWYKFTTTVTGNILFRLNINGKIKFDATDVQLFRETIPGDSTSKGLIYNPSTAFNDNTGNWSQTCISPGTYYLLLTGCNQINENVFPEIKIIEQAGDFCGRPVVAALNGTGTVVATTIVNCHTIGTDYGEFNPTLTCPPGATTKDYKSSWFRLDVAGNDTLDVTTFITENTNVNPSAIKYRMMTGSCGAMQEQSCVLDAQTQNTYKCLSAGSYFFQIFTPVYISNTSKTPVTGDIKLQLSAVKHTDSCAPINNCLANANFTPQFDCNKDTAVRFINYSTFGSAIAFKWDFGFNGKTSTEVSPSFNFPALATAATYNVKLVVTNTSCGAKDSVTVPVNVPARPGFDLGKDTSLCNGGSIVLNAATFPGAVYRWSTGETTPSITVNQAGSSKEYSVKVTYNGCSKSDTIKVNISPITKYKETKSICSGDSVQLNSSRGLNETYMWNTGSTNASIYAKQGGIYYNDLKWQSCIIRDTFIVTAPIGPFKKADTALCLKQPVTLNATVAGATAYIWQNGATGSSQTITNPGIYWVDISLPGCSFRDSIKVSDIIVNRTSINKSICNGQTYTLPSGKVVSTTGLYMDTLRTKAGCDSVIESISLTFRQPVITNITATICPGKTYTLPSGLVVNTPGTYADTLKSSGGCDSAISRIDLSVKASIKNNISAAICSGGSYTLPSGKIVNTAGSYLDTVRYTGGCDSLVTTVNLTIKAVNTVRTNATVCAGRTYTLPSGKIVNTSGLYNDTIRYVAGCDSLVTTINLSINRVINQSINVNLCAGQSYTLPSGKIAHTTGTYKDTIRYVAGCDSLVTTVNLSVNSTINRSVNAVMCAGQLYRLPSGKMVNATGTYKDTLRYVGGCDSLIQTITLAQKPTIRSSVAKTICYGQPYTLPSGKVVSAAGTYLDTIRYAAGCDSAIVTVNLAVKPTITTNSNYAICSGKTYTLPSGRVVNTSGIYRDTIRYITGCDSLIAVVDLKVTQPLSQTIAASICSGKTYTLPSGNLVNQAGTYRDTIRYASGCDSLVKTINLTVTPAPLISLTKSNDIDCILGTANLTTPAGYTYQWSPAATLSSTTINNPVASPVQTTTYRVKATTNKGCVAEDSIQVLVRKGNADNGYLVPSAFTPNSDGKNDCFGVKSWGTITDLNFYVYDRWGRIVFQTTDPSKCWDGTYNGEKLGAATFVYHVTANTNCGKVFRKGTVVLVR